MGMTSKKAMKIAERERLINDTMRRVEDQVINKVSTNCLAACCLILHDKFGFGKKRLSSYMMYVYDYFDSIYGNWLSFEDIRETIYDELGIDFDALEEEKVRFYEARRKGIS
jgi:hypothetical protein